MPELQADDQRTVEVPEIVYDGPETPVCIDCQSPTVRTGSCYSCLNCGSTTGCG